MANGKKTLIFFAGPTGSGKSSLVQKTVNYLKTKNIHVDLGGKHKNVIAIDDFIENHTLYKKLTFRIFYKYLRIEKNETYGNRIGLEEYNKYLDISPAVPAYTTIMDISYNLYKVMGSSDTIKIKRGLIDDKNSILLTDYLSAIYFYIRDTTSMSCKLSSSPPLPPPLPPPPPPPPPTPTPLSCSTFNDQCVYDLIIVKKDVGIETNMVKGYKDILVWYKSILGIFRNFLTEYRVVFSYTFVEFCDNIKRIENRFKTDIKQYLDEYIKKVTDNDDVDKEFSENEIKLFEENLKLFEKNNDYTGIKSAPRLPETDVPTFKNKFDAILSSIKENQKCLEKCDIQDHIYQNIDQRILIFNNTKNTSETSPIYDSDQNTELVLNETSPDRDHFEQFLNKHEIYASKNNCTSTGGRRTPRKTRRNKKKQETSRNKRRKTRCRNHKKSRKILI